MSSMRWTPSTTSEERGRAQVGEGPQDLGEGEPQGDGVPAVGRDGCLAAQHRDGGPLRAGQPFEDDVRPGPAGPAGSARAARAAGSAGPARSAVGGPGTGPGRARRTSATRAAAAAPGMFRSAGSVASQSTVSPRDSARAAAARASSVLPTPGGPVSRARPRVSRTRSSRARSSVRPTGAGRYTADVVTYPPPPSGARGPSARASREYGVGRHRPRPVSGMRTDLRRGVSVASRGHAPEQR